MPPTRPTFRETRKPTTRHDDSGIIYRDIAFVPSGSLAMKQTGPNTNKELTAEQQATEAASVSQIYRSALSIPSKKTAPTIKKRSITGSSKLSRTLTTKVEIAPDSGLSISQPTGTDIMSIARKSRAGGTLDKSKTGIDETIRRNWQSSLLIESSEGGSDRDIIKASENSMEDAVPAAFLTQLPTPSLTTEISKRVVAPGYILCEPCQMEVRETDWERHQSGTAHLMSKESPIQPLDRLKLGHENKGFRMLINSGWDYDKGLGVQGQGARHPVATRLKHDRLALGASGTSKKVITHTIEEIEASRTKTNATRSTRRVPLSAEDYRRKAAKDNKDRVNLMAYMKA